MPKFFIRGDHGQIIGTKEGEIFTRVIGGTTYQFGEADGTITELSSGWKVRGDTLAHARSRLGKADAASFANAVRIGAKLAASAPILPPLPTIKLPPLPGRKQ